MFRKIVVIVLLVLPFDLFGINTDEEYADIITTLNENARFSIYCNTENSEDREKSISYYPKLSGDEKDGKEKLIICINQFYRSDTNIIKYLLSRRNEQDTSVGHFYYIDIYTPFCSNRQPFILDKKFYMKHNNAYFNLILNYYLNKSDSSINLIYTLHKDKPSWYNKPASWFNRCPYWSSYALSFKYGVNDKTVKLAESAEFTQELYSKLDMIFAKHGFEKTEDLQKALKKAFRKRLREKFIEDK